MPDEYFSIKRLAAKTGEPEGRIRKLIQRRQLAISRESPRGVIRIAWSDWEAYHRRHRLAAIEETTPRGQLSDLAGWGRFQ